MTFQFKSFSTPVRAGGLALAAPLILVLAACSGDGTAGATAGGQGGPVAMAVETVVLAPQSVERKSEYIATVKSRRSTTIQPQVEGFITAIHARPGQRVSRGTPLMQIDAGRQQATVASLQSVRAARQADVQFALQQAERMKTLYEAGAVSQQEFEQASTAVQTSQAELRSTEAQIREQQVELAYHRVTSPTAGIVGDIPVRLGDSVTRSTVLTTVDENAGLELYINVPVGQAAGLKTGLPVRIVDDVGKPLATSELNFVSPAVDTATQSVLVKAPLEANAPFRSDQFVRTQVIWDNSPALTVPLVAVTRVTGQYFVYVAEKGDGGTLVARQRAVQLGPVVGNDYVVLSGLTEGEQLVVSGVQKIGDGMPVTVQQAVR